MNERPITFNAEMVTAILDGRKTQTRRITRPQPTTDTSRADQHIDAYCDEVKTKNNPRGMGRDWYWWGTDNRLGAFMGTCPYGQPGDWLWVREDFGISRQCDDINDRERVVVYRSGGEHLTDAGVDLLKRTSSGALMKPNHAVFPPRQWHAGQYMPRWASRITLEITDIRVQKLSDISEEDAKEEGTRYALDRSIGNNFSHRAAFAHMWEYIYGPGSWDADPYVWAITFKRVSDG